MQIHKSQPRWGHATGRLPQVTEQATVGKVPEGHIALPPWLGRRRQMPGPSALQHPGLLLGRNSPLPRQTPAQSRGAGPSPAAHREPPPRGGYRDREALTPWEQGTLVLVFSATKGISALTVALAHSRGLIDYKEKVATYWPEFAQNGKENITVRQLLGHQAGLCAFDEQLDAQVLADLDAVASILARQRPAWQPGTRHGYHYLSLGLYEGELIRRTDPHHRSLGRYFQEEVAAPLGLTFYIGLPPDVTDSKVATIESFKPLQMLLHMNTMPAGMVFGYTNPRSLTRRTFGNPKLRSPADFNRTEYRRVELPAGNGIGQVRSMAKAYGVFAAGNHELVIDEDTLEALAAPPTLPSLGSRDEVLKTEMSYSLGFNSPSTI
ncbi:MAG TPA: serine hydrolase domain-containing protein [Rubrobacter sp.]|nr:serine hydrolase domain-containing protein [Rubrobacter sp.]